MDKQQTRSRHGHGEGYLYAKAQGDAVITVSETSGNYQAACSVTVKRNTADIIFGSAGAGEPLDFSSLRFSPAKPMQQRIGKLSELHQRTDGGDPAGHPLLPV